MAYNFVACKPEEYSIKKGVFKYTGTADAIIIPDDVAEITNASIKNVKAIKLINATPIISTNRVECFEVDDTNSQYTSVDGVLFSKDKTTLIAYPVLCKEDEYTVPDSVSVIGKNAFANASLKNISVNSTNVSIIEEGAFKLTKKLLSFVWPSSVYEVSTSAFEGSGIKSIVLSGAVEKIGRAAFWNCISLTEINIPDSVKCIEMVAFNNCKKLASIELPDCVETIPSNCFGFCESLCTVKLPINLKVIEDLAFNQCKSLTSISLPDGLLVIGDSAFSFTGITSISVPSTVTETGTIFLNIHEVEYNGTMSEESKKKKAVVDEQKRQWAEIDEKMKQLDEKIAEIKEDGLYIYQQNAKRLVKKRDENQAKLNALYAARKYSEYNALLLETNEIPSRAVCVYNCCGKNIKLYQRNKLDCTFAIEADGIVHLINRCFMGLRDEEHNFSADASQLDKAIMAGIAGGSFLGYAAAKTAQIYNVINAGVTIYNTKTDQDIVRIRFGDNYRVHTAQFEAIAAKINEFNMALLKCVQEFASPDEIATAGYIDSSIDAIRADIESKQTRLAEKECREKEDSKNRFDSYWKLHTEEKRQLEEEIVDLKERIKNIKNQYSAQISALNKKLENALDSSGIPEIKNQIVNLEKQKASLGLFKGKEKKVLQAQIEALSAEAEAKNAALSQERFALENEIEALRKASTAECEPMNKRINEINAELNRER